MAFILKEIRRKGFFKEGNMLWISISKRSFCIHLCAFFLLSTFFYFFTHNTTQHPKYNKTKQQTHTQHLKVQSKGICVHFCRTPHIVFCCGGHLRVILSAVAGGLSSCFDVSPKQGTQDGRKLWTDWKVRYPNSFSSVHRWGGLHPKITEPTRTALCSPCCTKRSPWVTAREGNISSSCFYFSVCVYICVYVCMYVCVCMCVCVCVYIYIYIYSISQKWVHRALQCDHISRICDWKLLCATMKKYLGAPVRLTQSAYLCLCWGSFKGF